jgi:hypothetical protein
VAAESTTLRGHATNVGVDHSISDFHRAVPVWRGFTGGLSFGEVV